jgi:hypothetical protein
MDFVREENYTMYVIRRSTGNHCNQWTCLVDTAKEKETYVWEVEVQLWPDFHARVAAESLKQRRFRRTVQHGVAVAHARADDAASKCSCDLRQLQISDMWKGLYMKVACPAYSTNVAVEGQLTIDDHTNTS